MSWGINPNATEKEKIFAEFNDSINGLNCADGLSYRHYSKIFDLGRELADDEYSQGREDFAKELKEIFKEEIIITRTIDRLLKKDNEVKSKGARE